MSHPTSVPDKTAQSGNGADAAGWGRRSFPPPQPWWTLGHGIRGGQRGAFGKACCRKTHRTSRVPKCTGLLENTCGRVGQLIRQISGKAQVASRSQNLNSRNAGAGDPREQCNTLGRVEGRCLSHSVVGQVHRRWRAALRVKSTRGGWGASLRGHHSSPPCLLLEVGTISAREASLLPTEDAKGTWPSSFSLRGRRAVSDTSCSSSLSGKQREKLCN